MDGIRLRIAGYAGVFFLIGMLVGSFLFGSGSHQRSDQHGIESPAPAVVYPEKPRVSQARLPSYHPSTIRLQKSLDEEGETHCQSLPSHIQRSLRAMGLTSKIPDAADWQKFLENVKVEGLHELETEYQFDFLTALISLGKLPPDNFFSKFGYDLSHDDRKNRQLLQTAIQTLSLKNFKRLVSQGAKLDFIDSYTSKNLLNYALTSKWNTQNKIDYLLKQGFSFKKGEDYLLDAMEGNRYVRTRLLDKILQNTNLQAIDNKKTLFDRVLLKDASTKIIDHFIDNGFTFSNTKTTSNPLISSIMNGNISEKQYQKLIDLAGDPDLKIPSGQTALMIAVLRKRQDLVTTLLKNGANIDVTDNLGRSVFDYLGDATIIRKRYTEEEVQAMKALLEQHRK